MSYRRRIPCRPRHYLPSVEPYMNESVVNRIRQCASLPSLPAIALQVLEMAQKEQVDLGEIARIISKDPALSSKILRTVNSTFYGRSQSISTISHALVILGLQSVKTLVLGFSLVSNLTKTKARGFKHLTYWRRSIYAATAAHTLAGKLNVVQQEEVFLAALLMDIGMLVLDQVLEEQYGEINENAKNHAELVVVETSTLQMTHADVAGILTSQWKLPPVLSIPVAFHHRFADVEDPALRKLTEVVYYASRCADVFVDENTTAALAEVRTFLRDQHNITEAECDTIFQEISTRTKEMAQLFEINLGAAANFESILKRANETLVELTLRTQQQSVSLQEQNVKLKEQASTDGLTGLANRAAFDQFYAQNFEAALRNDKPLALILLDVDRFKSINDGYGHPVGDAVLRALSKIFRSAARSQDLAARFGGEEFVLVLPNTTRSTAAAISESIRRAIAVKPLACGNVTIAVTVSIGVAALEPPSLFREPAHLLKAADMAVYAAKAGGRNCVRVFSMKPALKPAA